MTKLVTIEISDTDWASMLRHFAKKDKWLGHPLVAVQAVIDADASPDDDRPMSPDLCATVLREEDE